MERTRNPKEIPKEIPLSASRLQVLSQLVARANFAARFAGQQQYGGDRDINEALGYKEDIQFKDYLGRYLRQDMAKAIIDRPVKATWQGPLELVESNEAEDTEFEEAWEELEKKLGIKTRLTRLDRLTGIGKYGVLLLGLDDVKDREGFAKEVAEGDRELIYIKPFSEESAKIDKYEEDTRNPRYGYPVMYNIEIADVASGNSSNVKVHYSRVLHITDDPLESEVVGTPRLEAVFNRLMDLEKIVGGDGEMFWRGARPGYRGKVDPDYTMTDASKEGLEDQLDEYEHKLRRFLINEGVDIEAMEQQIADPSTHVDVQIQMISAVTGIPKRILTGSERGELASSEDRGAWLAYVQARREDFAEPCIVRPFVDKLIALGVLPEPAEEYTVKWLDLFSVSEKDRVDIGKARATALREYVQNPLATEVVSPKAFFEFFLGLTKERITLIEEMNQSEMDEELRDTVDKILNPPEPKVVAAPAGAKPAAKKPAAKKPAK
jgi:uncharacterized protein